MLKFWGKDMEWFKLNHPKEYKRYQLVLKLKEKYGNTNSRKRKKTSIEM